MKKMHLAAAALFGATFAFSSFAARTAVIGRDPTTAPLPDRETASMLSGEGLSDNPTSPSAEPIAHHCPATLTKPGTCLETAQGRAGDVVEVEVYFVPTASCLNATETYGRFTVDAKRFALENAVSHIDCRTRRAVEAKDGKREISYQRQGKMNALCADPIGFGKIDVLAVRILPGTPPGDYPLTLDAAHVVGTAPGCDSHDVAVAGVIRVLP
jgi:hypothetical protein